MNQLDCCKKNIQQALGDYWAYTNQYHELYEAVGECFIQRLAEDSLVGKKDLRELFRKSEKWDEKLDAMILIGERTHHPNYKYVSELANRILYPVSREMTSEQQCILQEAIRFFLGASDKECVEALKEIAPRAYLEGRKKSRIFKVLCEDLGVADNKRGSAFQKLYAEISNEMAVRKIKFQLFVSLNAGHFMTMSNPKCDERGDMLTSCHTINVKNSRYNCGCSGFARDNVTFVAFTVDDPSNITSLNNRKTMRQLFMYQPRSGVLIQSRLYHTIGSNLEVDEQSTLYREMIQCEIATLEGAMNLWETTPYEVESQIIKKGKGFGGFPDWEFEERNTKISRRIDAKTNVKLTVGTYGLCLICGKHIDKGVCCVRCYLRINTWQDWLKQRALRAYFSLRAWGGWFKRRVRNS